MLSSAVILSKPSILILFRSYSYKVFIEREVRSRVLAQERLMVGQGHWHAIGPFPEVITRSWKIHETSFSSCSMSFTGMVTQKL